MASITQTPDGKWKAQIRKVGFKHKYETFDRKVDADRWARKVEAEMDRGVDSDLSVLRRTSVNDLLDRFEKDEVPGRAGARWEIIRIRQLRDTDLGHRRLDQDVPAALRAWRDSRLREVQAATVRREMNLLGSIFSVAIRRWGVPMTVNPVSLVERPSADNARVGKVWTETDFARLRAAAPARREGLPVAMDYVVPALELAIETAMRLREICQVRLDDVHLDERRIWLPGEITKARKGRNALLSSRAVEIVRQLQAMPRAEREDRLIPVEPDTLGLRFRQLRALAGLAGEDPLWMRDSRHTAATRAAGRLTNELELSAFTGHADPRMLKRYYHPDPTTLAARLG